MWEAVLLRIEVALAIGAILAAVKSLYSGYLYDRVIVPLDRLEGMADDVDRVRQRQEEMYEKQQYQIDAIIALARSMEEDNGEFDERAFRESVGRDNDPEDFLRGGGNS